jgi:serine/threonine-protein kinase PknG
MQGIHLMPELTTCTRFTDGAVCGGAIDDGYCVLCGRRADLPSQEKSTAPSQRTTHRTKSTPGLVTIDRVQPDNPRARILENPIVPVNKRVCRCGRTVGRRGQDGSPPANSGVCVCGRPFSFVPRLHPGDLLGGQYLIEGCLTHGGLGWIYLARDRNLDDTWVVLKGLLNEDDPDAAEAAIAERRFLIELKHPNIVQILNFVQQDGAGYIVMEYLPGKSLRDLRERVGRRHVLPVERAIEYLLAVFPALGYLHDQGLAYCDFKPDNIIGSVFAVKLIDLGAVFREGITTVQFGTPGFQAPEVRHNNPTVASDLYTVGRCLAVLCTDFDGRTDEYQYAIPGPDRIPLFARFDSLYRFLLKATAFDPAARFPSADEMAAQLALIQYEVVARQSDDLASPRSQLFGDERHCASTGVDPLALPRLRDVAEENVETPLTASLRAADALLEKGTVEEAEQVCAAIRQSVPNEWRAIWLTGVAALRRNDSASARMSFAEVYSEVPGELAPKLAMAFAAESAGDLDTASTLYDTVSATSPAMTSAAFGLARCAVQSGNRSLALQALDRVPAASQAWTAARLARVRLLIDTTGGVRPSAGDLVEASAIIDRLDLPPERRASVERDILDEVLRKLLAREVEPDSDVTVVGGGFTEPQVRRGLERAYRELARYARNHGERNRLVDCANQVRPWSRL